MESGRRKNSELKLNQYTTNTRLHPQGRWPEVPIQFWIEQYRFTTPETTHFRIRNRKFLIFVTFLNFFWVTKIKFTVPEATHFLVQNWDRGTSLKIVISRSRERNRVKCLIPRPGRWTHTHTRHVTHIEFLRSLHNRPFGQIFGWPTYLPHLIT